MLVREILGAKGNDVVSIKPDAPIAEVADLLKQHRIGAALVVDETGGLLGVISERDLSVASPSAAPCSSKRALIGG